MEMRPARFHSDPPIAQDIWLRRPSLTWSTLMNTPSICGQMIAGRLIWINIDIEADTRTRRSSMAAIDWTQQSPNLCTISCCSEIFHFFKLQLVFFYRFTGTDSSSQRNGFTADFYDFGQNWFVGDFYRGESWTKWEMSDNGSPQCLFGKQTCIIR